MKNKDRDDIILVIIGTISFWIFVVCLMAGEF